MGVSTDRQRRPGPSAWFRITAADLMVGTALIGLAAFLITHPVFSPIYLTPQLMPAEPGPRQFLIRGLVFGGMPLLAIAWQRRRGGRALLGGWLVGAVAYGGFVVADSYTMTRPDPFSLGVPADAVVFAVVGAVHGLILGLAAWGLGAVVRCGRERGCEPDRAPTPRA